MFVFLFFKGSRISQAVKMGTCAVVWAVTSRAELYPALLEKDRNFVTSLGKDRTLEDVCIVFAVIHTTQQHAVCKAEAGLHHALLQIAKGEMIFLLGILAGKHLDYV